MSVDELKKLSLEYPYSQPVQLIYAIRLNQSSEYLFNRQLGKTAVLTDDRTVLFDLFERDSEELGNMVVLTQPSEEAQEPEPKPLPPPVAIPVALEVPTPIADTPQPIEIPEESAAEVIEESKPEPPSEPMPEPTPVVEEPKKKSLDLTGLSPKEKVQAILAENKRIREEYNTKKVEGPTEESLEEEAKEEMAQPQLAVQEPEEDIEVEKIVVEPIAEVLEEKQEEPVFDPPVLDDASETEENSLEILIEEKEEASAVTEEVLESTDETEVEAASTVMFTIDEEKAEPIFEIESEVESEFKSEPERETDTLESIVESLEAKSISDLESEKHSLMEWLQILRERQGAKLEGTSEDAEEKDKLPLEKKIELLDSFVEKLPELKRKNISAPTPEKPSISLGKFGGGDDDALVTETLAKVYIGQKHYSKAIKAYEILKLKYPEKSGFFADQILEIKKLINSK